MLIIFTSNPNIKSQGDKETDQGDRKGRKEITENEGKQSDKLETSTSEEENVIATFTRDKNARYRLLDKMIYIKF